MLEEKAAEAANSDVFEEAVMSENRSYSQGYAEGLQIAKERSQIAGYDLGLDKGIQLGQEIGFYSGFAHQLNSYCDTKTNLSDKKIAAVRSFYALVQEMSGEDDELDIANPAFTDKLEKIRNQFKKI